MKKIISNCMTEYRKCLQKENFNFREQNTLDGQFKEAGKKKSMIPQTQS